MMDSHYSALQETVFWAVGGVLALAALIAGVNIFLGVRSFARDKTAIQAELEGAIAERLADVESTLTAASRSASQALESSSALRIKEFSDTMSARLDALGKSTTESIDRKVSSLKGDVDSINLASAIAKADNSIDDGRLDYGLWMLASAIDLTETASGGSVYLSDVIGKINKALDKASHTDIQPDTSAKLIKSLGKIESSYEHEAEIAKERIIRIRSNVPPAV